MSEGEIAAANAAQVDCLADCLAAKVLLVLLRTSRSEWEQGKGRAWSPDDYAAAAYDHAEAMVRERARRQQAAQAIKQAQGQR